MIEFLELVSMNEKLLSAKESFDVRDIVALARLTTPGQSELDFERSPDLQEALRYLVDKRPDLAERLRELVVCSAVFTEE